ncbi:hypothetical protein MKW94_015646, partial [Papaver nudicaule]|nr:hypothetical protein [Papaver nudicaule]
ENLNDVDALDAIHMFFKAVNMLQQPLEQLLEDYQPDFIVADMILHWATESAGKFGIPRFIEMTRLQVPDTLRVETAFGEMFQKIKDSEIKSYGVLVNSFYELEPAYADHYRNIMGRRAWQIGPVSLRNKNTKDKAQRGKQFTIDEHYVLNWLDSKEPNSVLYICFGSLSRMNNAQLFEIATALEDQNFAFVWVIRRTQNNEEKSFLPECFEEKIKGKGLIIREWAPQVLILEHPSIGGFMTHCGWNSTLE